MLVRENDEIYIRTNVNKIILNVEMWWQGKQQIDMRDGIALHDFVGHRSMFVFE